MIVLRYLITILAYLGGAIFILFWLWATWDLIQFTKRSRAARIQAKQERER